MAGTLRTRPMPLAGMEVRAPPISATGAAQPIRSRAAWVMARSSSTVLPEARAAK